MSATSDDAGINVSDWDQVENWAVRPPADEKLDHSGPGRMMRSPWVMTLAGGAVLAALAWAVPSDGPEVTPGPTHPATSSPPTTAISTARAAEAEFNLTEPVNRQFVVEVTASGKVFYSEVDLTSGRETVLAQGTTNGAPGTAQATGKGVVMGLLPQDAYGAHPLLKPGNRGGTAVETTRVGATGYQAYLATFSHPADAARFQGLLWTGAGGTLHGPSGPVPTADFPSTHTPLSGHARVWAAPEYGAVGLDLDGAVYGGKITALDGLFATNLTMTTVDNGAVTMVYGVVPHDGTVTKVSLSDGRDLTTAVTTTPLPGTRLAAFYGEAPTTEDNQATLQHVTWRDKAGHENHRRGEAASAE